MWAKACKKKECGGRTEEMCSSRSKAVGGELERFNKRTKNNGEIIGLDNLGEKGEGDTKDLLEVEE